MWEQVNSMDIVVESSRTPSVVHKVVSDNKQNKMMPYVDEFLYELQQCILKIIYVRPYENYGYM